MRLASSAVNRADALPSSCIGAELGIDVRQTGADDVVGNRLLDAQSGTKVPAQAEVERELDDVIAQLANKAVHARASGDPQGARQYVDRMMAAIRSRTLQHQARLEREALARVDEDPCYFSTIGEMHRERGHG